MRCEPTAGHIPVGRICTQTPSHPISPEPGTERHNSGMPKPVLIHHVCMCDMVSYCPFAPTVFIGTNSSHTMKKVCSCFINILNNGDMKDQALIRNNLRMVCLGKKIARVCLFILAQQNGKRQAKFVFLLNGCRPMRCGTASRPIYWKAARIFAQYRTCWDIQIFQQPRFICT